MKLRQIFPFLFIAFLWSCNSNKVTKIEDYSLYLITTTDNSELMANANLWTEKLENSPSQFSYLLKRANAYTQLFAASGKIEYLIKAEKDLINGLKMTDRKFPSFLKSLASNYISQHRFRDALVVLEEAKTNGEKLNGTKKMLFDVHLELGNYLKAEAYLNQIKNTSDFDYLIRLAKWNDHNGNLEGAIEHMEKATAIAEASNIKSTKQWAYTNLADFYGHAGKIEKSYQYYLKALELDPKDAYSKKGIAWIIYSYEKNPDEALRILNHISTYYNVPDYNLLKAEIADYKNDTVLKSMALKNYRKEVKNELYGAMYNAYNVKDYAEELMLPESAVEIAKHEVENRPTPQSYDLLAWSYYKNGEIEKAYTIVEDYVEGQIFEPEVLYHIAKIYKAKGRIDKVTLLKEELIASLYELGPTMKKKINNL